MKFTALLIMTSIYGQAAATTVTTIDMAQCQRIEQRFMPDIVIEGRQIHRHVECVDTSPAIQQ